MITLDKTALIGKKSGTEEYGKTRLWIILKFASRQFTDVLLYAALDGIKNGHNDICISVLDLCTVVYDSLQKQDEEFAKLWNDSYGYLLSNGKFLKSWFENSKGTICIDEKLSEGAKNVGDLHCFMDLEALKAQA